MGEPCWSSWERRSRSLSAAVSDLTRFFEDKGSNLEGWYVPDPMDAIVGQKVRIITDQFSSLLFLTFKTTILCSTLSISNLRNSPYWLT